MSRPRSLRALSGSGSLSLPNLTIKIVGSVEAGGGACFRLGGLAIDCGANPNGGTVADFHLNKLVGSAINSPINDLVVSHFHLDHHGGLLPILKAYAEKSIPLPVPRIICTDTTWDLLRPHMVEGGFFPDGPRENSRSVYHATRTKTMTLIRNEHSVPGSVGLSLELPNRKRVFYTGDFRKFPRLPKDCLRPDLCIVDCTGAQRMEPTEGKEELIRENIMALTMETLVGSNGSVYVSTFSTQLDRICWLENACRECTKFWPSLAGTSFFVNTGAYRRAPWGKRTERFVLCSGVWAQPGSKLVQMSEDRDRDYRLSKGDRVILSGSMPTWNQALMGDVSAMCNRLTQLGVEVIVDSSLGLEHMPSLRRAEIHCSGHASYPEIIAFLKQLRPKSIFATHGSLEARGVIEEYCRRKGIGVVSMNSSSEIVF